MEKIAVVTDNGNTISQHFGRARYYKVITLENGKIIESEMRERKAGHHGMRAHDHHHNHSGNGEHRHGYDAESVNRHSMMAREISDCEVLLAGGMGMGAYEHLREAGLKVVLTDVRSIDEAVELFAQGKLENLVNARTH